MGPEKRVLIVDDEFVIADTLRAIFSSVGYSAQAVFSAEEALPLIAAWNPHLVIIDVRLPGMNGVDLALQMKADYPSSSLLLFTGDSSVVDLLDSAERRGHHFKVLMKPVPPAEFLKTVAGFFPPATAIAPGTA